MSTIVRPAFLVTTGRFWFRWRNALFPLLFLVVFLPGPRIFGAAPRAAAAGFLVAALGQVVRAATIGIEYVIRGGRDGRVYAEDLVVAGLYRHVRNPMYVGNVLILLGVALASDSWTCVLVAVPLFLAIYTAIVAAEEQFLAARFGAQYEQFVRTVPRWVPRLRGLASTLRERPFQWRRIALKEYGTPFGWVSGVLLLALWNLWRDGHAFVGHGSAVTGIVACQVGVIALWAAARAMKRAQRANQAAPEAMRGA
jgi:protein-S-isoprenylcysteine O-methyltransferase Ste14